jgi:hypothetical protein
MANSAIALVKPGVARVISTSWAKAGHLSNLIVRAPMTAPGRTGGGRSPAAVPSSNILRGTEGVWSCRHAAILLLSYHVPHCAGNDVVALEKCGIGPEDSEGERRLA